MKRFLLFSVVVVLASQAMAQPLNPVTWSFSAKKTADKTYEISMTATMQTKWHLYSQIQPADVDIIPTTFTISPNPLFTLDGKVKEVGALEKYKDKDLGVTLHQYSKTVTFVQKVKMKGNVKTNFNGSVEYQTCDDHQCLPPKTVPFSVALK